jgi:hypothetical protein
LTEKQVKKVAPKLEAKALNKGSNHSISPRMKQYLSHLDREIVQPLQYAPSAQDLKKISDFPADKSALIASEKRNTVITALTDQPDTDTFDEQKYVEILSSAAARDFEPVPTSRSELDQDIKKYHEDAISGISNELENHGVHVDIQPKEERVAVSLASPEKREENRQKPIRAGKNAILNSKLEHMHHKHADQNSNLVE